MTAVRERLTLEAFLQLPERKPTLEFADGVVSRKVSPKWRHARLQTKLADLINRFAEPRKLAVATAELRATFAGMSQVPDVAVFRWERIPRLPNGDVPDDIFVPPDIAVEIRSPRQSARGLIRKCSRYIARGVQIALLVDPDDRTIRLFRADGSITTLSGDDRIDVDAVLPGFELTVAGLFATLRLD